MKKQVAALITLIFISIAACNSVQKSVEPGGQGPIPKGSNRDIDEDTIKRPASDTTDTAGR